MTYRTLVVDPPWPQHRASPTNARCALCGRLRWEGKGGRCSCAQPQWITSTCSLPYSTMTVTDIAAMPVAKLADSDAHLYLWTTQHFLRDAFSVVEAWQFQPEATLVWCKQPRGFAGNTYMSSTEFVLFCRRGSLPAKRRQLGTWFCWPRSAHSAKPEAFLDMVEQVSPGPYAELFARRARLGWEYPIGNEALGGVTV